jgi:TolB-like protein/DNA-binding SARP family transcriptional activator
MASIIRLRTLGSVQLHGGDGQELSALLAQPRRVALLVYLLMARPRDFHRRDKLLALFWPEHDEPRARNALNQALHFIRRSLGTDALVGRGDGDIALDRALIWCDALAFEEALHSGRTDEALELYRGPFLDGFHLSAAAPELDHWLEEERARQARRYCQALDQMASSREAARDPSGAAVWLRKLAATDPVAARPALRLMRALAESGDRAAALHHARVHELLVREQLGTPVDPEIAAFVRRLQTEPLAERVDAITRPAESVESATSVKTAPDVARPPIRSRVRTRPWRAGASIVAALLALVLVGALVRTRGRGAAPAPAVRCLAVLPIQNVSRDSVWPHLSAGITDDIITGLAPEEELKVISHTSTMRYERAGALLPKIGEDLNCDGIVEGTMRLEGTRVHLNVQLLDAAGDRHLWAHAFEGDLSDIMVLEGMVTDSLVRHVLFRAPRGRVVSRKVDTVTYGLYLRGRDAFRSRNPASLRQALAFFHQATARDSSFAPAYAGLADAYRFLGESGYASFDYVTDSARLAAARALALDSTSSDAHTSLAAILTDRADWQGAEAEFKRAIALAPSNALARHWYAVLLATLGRKEDAVLEIQHAAELDPLSQTTHGAVIDIERYAGIRKPFSKVPDRDSLIDPTHPGAIAIRSVRQAQTGNCPGAFQENARAQDLAPNNTQIRLTLVSVYSFCNERLKGRALLDTIEHRPDAPLSSVFIAALFAARKQPDSAFAWLDRAQWTMQGRYQLRVLPALGPLRPDPRFAKLLARMGLR